jgi:hypothetical protein
MKVLKNSLQCPMEESSVPTLENLDRMEKSIKGVRPMISTYDNDQPEVIKVMRRKTGQESPRENTTLELSEGVVQLNIDGRTGGNKNPGNKFAWCNGLALCLHGLLIVGYDLTVSPDIMIVTGVSNEVCDPGTRVGGY